MLCEQGFELQYRYQQQGQLDEDDPGYYNIESIQYPDKANHLRHMRIDFKTIYWYMRAYSNDERHNLAVVMTEKSPQARYILREKAFDSIFGRASTLEKQPPFNMPEEVSGEGASPTRQKMRVIPTRQQGDEEQGLERRP